MVFKRSQAFAAEKQGVDKQVCITAPAWEAEYGHHVINIEL